MPVAFEIDSFLYTANAQFKDLKDFTSALAKENGLELSPESAWAWLAQGGFIDEDLTVGVGGFSLVGVKSSSNFLTQLKTGSPLEENNVLSLDLTKASWRDSAVYANGSVSKAGSYVRDGKVLPLQGHFEVLVNLLEREKRLPVIAQMIATMAQEQAHDPEAMTFLAMLPEAIEGMIRDGWIKPTYDPKLPMVDLITDKTGFHLNKDTFQKE